MRRRVIKQVVAGKDLIFALGEDINTQASSSTIKDSKASTNGLQEIPEREERPSSGTMTQKMPTLNLSKIHKGSTQSLKKILQKSKSRSKTP